MILVGLFSVACQQGTRKDAGHNVYQSGLQRCEELNQELLGLGVNLEGAVPSEGENSKVLPAKLRGLGDHQNSVQITLEKYVLSATELISLGDEKVVLFPERQKMQKSLNQANVLLGRIYAEKKWGNDRNPVQNPEIDESEYNARFARISAALKLFSEMGIDVNKEKETPRVIRNLKNSQLQKISQAYESTPNDLYRMKELAERNNHWGIAGLEMLTRNTQGMGGYFYQVNESAVNELARRTK